VANILTHPFRRAVFQSFLREIFIICMQRLQSHRTVKFIKSYLVFMSLLICLHGGDLVVQCLDGVQPGLFQMILDKLWLPNVLKVFGPLERKLCSVAMTKLLVETTSMQQPAYLPFLPRLVQANIALFEAPEDDSAEEGEGNVEVDEEAAYAPAYAPLAFATKADADPFPQVEPRAFLSAKLKAAPEPTRAAMQQLPQAVHAVLAKYLQ
jgi:exportin-2 (importin alpha re-exporter)